MKNPRLKFLVGSVIGGFAYAILAAGLVACTTRPPAKSPVILISGDNSLVLPAGNVLRLEDGRVLTTRVDFLMLSRDAVSNLQARGYLP